MSFAKILKLLLIQKSQSRQQILNASGRSRLRQKKCREYLQKKVFQGPESEKASLEPGTVGETVGHDDVLVKVVGARGAVTFHLVNHLADREDGGGRGGGGVGLHV